SGGRPAATGGGVRWPAPTPIDCSPSWTAAASASPSALPPPSEDCESSAREEGTRVRSGGGGAPVCGPPRETIRPPRARRGPRRGGETRRLHVGRLHGAGGIDDEDHRRPLPRHEARDMRPRDCEAEQREPDQDDRGHHAPPPAPLVGGDGGEDLEVREPDGV